MFVTRTLAWGRDGGRLVAQVDPPDLGDAAAGFFPDLRIDADLAPAPADLHLTEALGSDGRSGFGLRVRAPIPGGTGSGAFASAADALRSFELALAEWAAAGTGDALRVHASGAVIDGGAVLLVGPSGSGKSTLVAALARDGHPVLGDDMVPIERTTRHASAFRRLVKVEGDGARLLGVDPPRGPAARFWPDASLLHPGELGSRWGDPAPVRAILFPRRPAWGESPFAPIAPSAALEILLRERVLPGDASRDFELLSDLLNATAIVGVLPFDDAREGAERIVGLAAG